MRQSVSASASDVRDVSDFYSVNIKKDNHIARGSCFSWPINYSNTGLELNACDYKLLHLFSELMPPHKTF